MRLLLAAALVLALAAPALACSMTTSTPVVEFNGFYVPNNVGCTSGTPAKLYQETNGIPGLQRLDECGDDTCGGFWEPDTIVA